MVLKLLRIREEKMRPLREILLPIDITPPCIDVARYAAGVARHFSSKITLLRVLPPLNPAFAAFGSAAMLDEVLDHQDKETWRCLNSYLAGEFRGISLKRVVSEGDPAEIIATYCASERVGLVMMPTQGCAAFRPLPLGSVTAKVLQDVHCPVWTSSPVTDQHAVFSPVPKVIVCAIDRAPGGGRIMKWAADLASGLHARLIVAHAISPSEFRLETHFPGTEVRRAFDDAQARISNVLRGSPMPGAEIRVKGGSVPNVVRSVVKDGRADLLIIGRASSGRMMRRSWTHSYTLIRESACPVISI